MSALKGKRVKTPTLWSLLTAAFEDESRPWKHMNTRAHFVGDVLHSPVSGRVITSNAAAATLSFETLSFHSRLIVAPVAGRLIRIDSIDTNINRDKTAAERQSKCYVLHIECEKSFQTIQLTLVGCSHGTVSRMRLLVRVGFLLQLGDAVAYGTGTFETRLKLPSTALITIDTNVPIQSQQTVLGTVYRTF